MPTVLRDGPYRFFFYSADGSEPPHVHVQRDDHVAKFWLSPVRLADNGGFKRAEIQKVKGMVDEHVESLLRSWNEFFAG
jgi:hypothetical protein